MSEGGKMSKNPARYENAVAASLGVLEKAISIQAPLTAAHIDRIRRKRPDASPQEIVHRLNAEFRSATILAGAGVGAAAAAPGVGTSAALLLSGAEGLAFINATVLYILARGDIQGIAIEDVERRRMLILAVMLGDAGATGVSKVAERTGQHWAKQVVTAIPYEKVLAINKFLGKNFVTKYGTKQGIVVLGRVIPFGIGAVIGGAANGLFSQGIISASDRAFGPPERDWNGLSIVDSKGAEF